MVFAMENTISKHIFSTTRVCTPNRWLYLIYFGEHWEIGCYMIVANLSEIQEDSDSYYIMARMADQKNCKDYLKPRHTTSYQIIKYGRSCLVCLSSQSAFSYLTSETQGQIVGRAGNTPSFSRPSASAVVSRSPQFPARPTICPPGLPRMSLTTPSARNRTEPLSPALVCSTVVPEGCKVGTVVSAVIFSAIWETTMGTHTLRQYSLFS